MLRVFRGVSGADSEVQRYETHFEPFSNHPYIIHALLSRLYVGFEAVGVSDALEVFKASLDLKSPKDWQRLQHP